MRWLRKAGFRTDVNEEIITYLNSSNEKFSIQLPLRHDGVVSYPSDNKKFDHEGEREVANAILILRQ